MTNIILATALLLHPSPPRTVEGPIPTSPVERTFAATLRADALTAHRDSTPRTFISFDKVQHFGMTYAVTTFAYGVARSAGAGNDAARVGAVAVAAAAGIGKEMLDRRRGGPLSAGDLIADAAGAVAAFATISQIR